MTRIILVRHGQTEWNRVERFRGRADVPLDNTGMAQADATGRRIATGWQVSAVYCSPLSRAVKTAEAIAGHFGLVVQPYPGLVDIDYGLWQGLTPAEVQRQWPELIEAWYKAPQTVQIPQGETLEHLRARGLASVNELVTHHPGQTLVLVAHTAIIRAILLGVLGLGNERFWRLHQDTCAINVFDADAGDFTMISLNDTCHLHP